MELSPRQQLVLDFIRDFRDRHGFPPSLREIGAALDIGSTNAVRDHLLALERKGAIERSGTRSRGLTVLSGNPPGKARADTAAPPARPQEYPQVPLVGRIAAGTPLLAQENIEDHITLDPRLLKGPVDHLFALRVQGDSMIEAGILDGDFIVVRHQDDAADGSIVVVLLDDEATVKSLFREPGQVRLQPANAAMKPLIFREEDGLQPQIQGVVVAILRTL